MLEVQLDIPLKIELIRKSYDVPSSPYSVKVTRQVTFVAYTVAGQTQGGRGLEEGWTSLKLFVDTTDGLGFLDQCNRIDDSAHADIHFGPIIDFLREVCRVKEVKGVMFLSVPTHWIRYVRAYEK